MIRLELNDLHELMQLYQCAMQGKFAGADAAAESDNGLLSSPKLGSAMDILVDRLITEARASQNEPMVEMMEEYRQLQSNYPQYAALLAYAKQLQSSETMPSTESLRALLVIAAKPLLLSDAIFEQILLDSTPRGAEKADE